MRVSGLFRLYVLGSLAALAVAAGAGCSAPRKSLIPVDSPLRPWTAPEADEFEPESAPEPEAAPEAAPAMPPNATTPAPASPPK